MHGPVIALLALVLVAGCAYGDDDEAATTSESPARVTASERQWAELAGEWTLQLGGEFNAVAVDDCAASLAEHAGPRPSERVSEIEQLALEVCRAYRRLAGAGADGRDAALAAASRAELRLNEAVYALEFVAGPNQPLPVKGGLTETSRVEPRLSRVLARVLGREAETRCWSESDWRTVATHNPYGPGELGGFVDSAGKIQLSPSVCRALAEYLYGVGDEDAPGLEVAVVVFAHEARHAAGIDREELAECYGMQDAPRFARLLGFSRAAAQKLVERYWEEVYPDQDYPYFSPQCRDGGRLDLRPRSDIWP